MLLGFTGSVFLSLGDLYLFPSIAAVVVGGTILAGGAGSYSGAMSGLLVLALITSLLTALQLPEAFRLMILGPILLALLSVYGRQRGLCQWLAQKSPRSHAKERKKNKNLASLSVP